MLRHWMQVGWLLGLMAWSACGGAVDGGGGPGTDGNETPRPGIGASVAAPAGTPYALPVGVELLSPIEGYDLGCIPEEQESQAEVGSGTLVSACLKLRNTSAQPISIELPAGLILVSDDLSSQNGLLVQAVPLQVPAGQTLAVALHLYCINETRAPTASWDTYTLGPVTRDPGLREVITLVEDKFLPVPGLDEVQYAIANVTDGPGLTSEDRQALESLPPRSTTRAPGAGP